MNIKYLIFNLNVNIKYLIFNIKCHFKFSSQIYHALMLCMSLSIQIWSLDNETLLSRLSI